MGYLKGFGILRLGHRDLFNFSTICDSDFDETNYSADVSIDIESGIHIGLSWGHRIFYLQIGGIQKGYFDPKK